MVTDRARCRGSRQYRVSAIDDAVATGRAVAIRLEPHSVRFRARSESRRGFTDTADAPANQASLLSRSQGIFDSADGGRSVGEDPDVARRGTDRCRSQSSPEGTRRYASGSS
jgi:hypothetical protein